MSVREIVTVGHPVLRERAVEVTVEELATPETQQFIDDLIDTMRHANGAGSGRQPGRVPVRIATIEVGDNPRYPYKPRIPLTVVVNPIIEPIDDELVEINEGCLSVPNLRGSVMRHVNVRVRYLDRDGGAHDEIRRGLDGRHVPARVRSPRWRAVPRSCRSTRRRSPRGSSSSGSTAPRSSSGSLEFVAQSRHRDDLLVRVGVAGRSRRRQVEHGVAITIERRSDHGRQRRRQSAAGRPPSWRVDAAGNGQRPQPRLSPCAAWTNARRVRFVLDVARSDVCTRRPPRPRPLSRFGPGDVRRDGAGRIHLCRRVPLPAPRPRWRAVRAAERRWAKRCSMPRRRPASGSPCSTRATCVPVWRPTPSSTTRSSGSATAMRTRGRRESTASTARHGQDRRGDPLGAQRRPLPRCRS